MSVSSDKVKAAFAVESFSSFTITWVNDRGNEVKSVTFKYVDQNGNEIDSGRIEAGTEIHLDDSAAIRVDEYAFHIDGYNYTGAKLNFGIVGKR